MKEKTTSTTRTTNTTSDSLYGYDRLQLSLCVAFTLRLYMLYESDKEKKLKNIRNLCKIEEIYLYLQQHTYPASHKNSALRVSFSFF